MGGGILRNEKKKGLAGYRRLDKTGLIEDLYLTGSYAVTPSNRWNHKGCLSVDHIAYHAHYALLVGQVAMDL